MRVQKWDKYYLPALEHVLVNEDDESLVPVKIPQPKPPRPEEIANYGLDPEKQFYWCPRPSQKLIELNERTDLFLKTPTRIRDRKVDTPEKRWKYLMENIEQYQDEYDFILDHWRRRMYGKWIYINGRPHYIPPTHEFFISSWMPERFQYDFRYSQHKYFQFHEMAKADPKCCGDTWIKGRQIGATAATSSIVVGGISMAMNKFAAVQSYSEDNAKENAFQTFIVNGYNNMFFYFKPIDEGHRNPKSEIVFQRGNKYTGDSSFDLGSRIMVGATGPVFDGWRLAYYWRDEGGKCVRDNVDEVHNVHRICVNPTPEHIRGHALYPTTVEEMDKKGGKNFKKLVDKSHYDHPHKDYKRDENGMTQSGMYAFFLPADDGMMGYIDEYGFSERDRAKTAILNERKTYIMKDDNQGLADIRRKKPLKLRESFMSMGRGANFDVKILSDRIDEIEIDGKVEVVRGSMMWENDVPDTRVIFYEDSDGFFVQSHMPAPALRNNFITELFAGKTVQAPSNDKMYIAGGDPFKSKETKVDTKKSKGGGAVFWLRDQEIDPNTKPLSEWITHRFVCTYLGRPTRGAYSDDMIKMCVFYGCKINIEINFPWLEEIFISRNYDGYLWAKPDIYTGFEGDKTGTHAGTGTFEEICGAFTDYVKRHGMREQHLRLLRQLAEVDDDMGPYDLFAAAGHAIKAAEYEYKKDKRRKEIFNPDAPVANIKLPKWKV